MRVVTKIKKRFTDKVSLTSVRIPADEQLKVIDCHLTGSYKLPTTLRHHKNSNILESVKVKVNVDLYSASS